jgi:hypothetical protein
MLALMIDSNQSASIPSILSMANRKPTHNKAEMARLGEAGRELLNMHIFDDQRFQLRVSDVCRGPNVRDRLVSSMHVGVYLRKETQIEGK